MAKTSSWGFTPGSAVTTNPISPKYFGPFTTNFTEVADGSDVEYTAKNLSAPVDQPMTMSWKSQQLPTTSKSVKYGVDTPYIDSKLTNLWTTKVNLILRSEDSEVLNSTHDDRFKVTITCMHDVSENVSDEKVLEAINVAISTLINSKDGETFISRLERQGTRPSI